jgi:hypothetical protein
MDFTGLAHGISVDVHVRELDVHSFLMGRTPGITRSPETTIRFVVEDMRTFTEMYRELRRVTPHTLNTHQIDVDDTRYEFVLTALDLDAATRLIEITGRVVGRSLVHDQLTAPATRAVSEPAFHAPWGMVRRALNV